MWEVGRLIKGAFALWGALALAGLLAALPALAAGDGTFTLAPDSPFTAGSTPDAIAPIDFNADGDPDLIAPNRDSSDLTSLVGGADATFTASQLGAVLPAGGSPADVAAADLNGDANPDFVVSNPAAAPNTSITIFLVSVGAITPTTVNVPQRPSRIAIGNFDGDGDRDIAVTTAGNERMAVLTNNGAGTFTIANSATSVGDGATSIATGDFNGDGDPDLAVTSSLSGAVTILTGGAGATFTREPTAVPAGAQPSDVAIADFNGDGDPDLAATNAGSDDVTLATGQASAGFAAAGTIPVGDRPSSLVATDLNGDGRADLAVTNQTQGAETGSVSILLGNGAAAFTQAPGSPITVGAEPLGVVATEVNADGALDLATANGGSDNITVLLGNTPGGGGSQDTTPPQTTINRGPQGATSKHKAKIAYSANEPATFQCKLKGKGVDQDLRAFTACGAAKVKYKRLDSGKKTFQVRAVDAAGNVDPSPAKLKWKVLG